MGEMIEFAREDGSKADGYLAVPPSGSGPGILVIQEWWGLVDQIKGTCDRLAGEGFFALAPDLYGGRTVPLHEPDEAAKEMLALQLDEASADMSGAVDVLIERSGRPTIGVVGFCMGGGLALALAAQRPGAIAAVAPCYGVYPWGAVQPSYEAMTAATQIHCAGRDEWFTPEAAEELAGALGTMGLDVELHLYPESHHAFFNEDRPEVFDPAAGALLWTRLVRFFSEKLA